MSLTPGGMREGRDNVLKLMKILGNPQDNLRVFHVTGSNGKGSVCQMISQVLWKQLGKKVGLFTSPHLITINERFQINGIPISDSNLDNYYEQVIKLAKKHDIPLSFFEIQVVVMVFYFTEAKVDYAVVEVGLGGTYDGTNIFTHPLACLITSITLEHTHLLGNTRNSVLKNKLGIVKPKSKLYTWIDNKVVRDYCAKIGALYRAPLSRGVVEDRGVSESNTKPPASSLGTPLDRGARVTNLPGPHQQKNALLVLQSLLDLGFKEKEILAGLQKIENLGRFQWLTTNILLDSANNAENIKILAKMVKKINRGIDEVDEPIGTGKKKKISARFIDLSIYPKSLITVIFGTTQTDPTYAAKLAQMIPAKKRILVDDFCDRALPCSQYAHMVPHDEVIHWGKHDKTIMDKTIGTTLEGNCNSLNRIIALSDYQEGTIVIIYGSIYLIGEILKLSTHRTFAKQ